MLKKIYLELVLIRKELQAIRVSLESKSVSVHFANSDGNNLIKKDGQDIKVVGGISS